MKERPIIFSAPMVRAILEDRKTQTRRICKNSVYSNGFHFDGHEIVVHNDYLPPSATLMDVKRGRYEYTTSDYEGWEVECPYGQPGDRLWVRETWAAEELDRERRQISIQFKATPQPKCRGYVLPRPHGFEIKRAVQGAIGAEDGAWRPSIHMPRWASRITLEITGVRVERLQEISEADAIAEGIDGLHDELFMKPENLPSEWAVGNLDSPVFSFATLWQSINGPGSWDANPFVWCIEFRRIEQQRLAA